MKINRSDRPYAVIIALFIVLSLGAGIYGASARGAAASRSGGAGAESTDNGPLLNRQVFHTRTEISSEIIKDSLTKMGFLVTAKYFFKDVTTTSKVSSIGNFDVGFTRANLVFSYEGYVPAGIDFSETGVTVNPETKTVILDIPEAEIMDVFIDPESFEVLDERENIFNKFKVEDYNNGLKDLEEHARGTAVERGLLDEAQKNAEIMILNFVSGFTDDAGYRAEIRH